jgi:Cobalamin-5-phosphate synthase
MPKVKWDSESMEYVFCFFPLVALPLGALYVVWCRISELLELNTALIAVVCVLLPILYTGGIHMDGMCDTMDALASNAERERKLEILKDSNTGAFAVIGCSIYLAVQFGLWYQAVEDGVSPVVMCVIFVLSRSLSALAAVTMRNARKSGMLVTFTDAVRGKRVFIVVILWIIATVTLLIYLDPFAGVTILVGAALMYMWYAMMSRREFGGITGDLEGYFLQMCELGCLLAMVLAERLVAVL